MPNYQQSKIYKIVCDVTSRTYIGSTVQSLPQRMSEHRHRFKNDILFCSSHLVLENNNYKMELIENFPCENKEELHLREQFHIENTDCVNDRNAFATEEIKREQHRLNYERWFNKNPERNKERMKIRSRRAYEKKKAKENQENETL